MPYDPDKHGPKRVVGPGFNARVYEIVRRVPPGSLTTYGDVAGVLGLRRAARQVGYALAAIPAGEQDVPWFRVVNARGRISPRAEADIRRQRRALKAEGIHVDAQGRVKDFDEHRHLF